ncbi:MAG TPA: hypothetical protein VMS56_15360 [Thermoanaerobaculia bacterium]|nr:hypothetical protein [Thermoanaerobaculia bacterium]
MSKPDSGSGSSSFDSRHSTIRALEPLERWELEHTPDLPETFPWSV